MSEVVSAGVVAIIAVVFGLQKILKGWKETSAETNVISLMHDELERMASQNKELSKELMSLQIEIVNLGRELRKLSEEIKRLHHEVSVLTEELNRLQEILKSHDLAHELKNFRIN